MPNVSVSLDWLGDLKFSNGAGGPAMALDSGDPAVSSPPQALAYAVMACMGMDVVHVIKKGRHDLQGLTVAFSGERAEEHPRRFVSLTLTFKVTGDVPDHVVARAIELSRETYCSVWNTIRTDVALETRFEIAKP
jgi:putative redox protein